MPLPFQEVIFYGDDDVTVIATVSSDPAHAKPYLMPSPKLGEAEADWVEGRAKLGQISFGLLDKRVTASNKATGWFTALLATHNGLLGHRFVYRIQRKGSVVYDTRFDGVILSHPLDDDKVVYTITGRDIRERERTYPLFTKLRGTALLPRGFDFDYGKSEGGTPLIPAVAPLVGKFWRDPRRPTVAGRVKLDARFEDLFPTPKDAADWMTVMQERGALVPLYNAAHEPIGQAFSGVTIKWRAEGSGGAWTTLSNMSGVSNTEYPFGNVFPQDLADGLRMIYQILVNIVATGASLPAHEQRVEIIVLAEGRPSEDLPLAFEEQGGDLLEKIVDGYWNEYPMGIEIEPAALAALKVKLPVLRAMIFEPVKDAREWLAEHFYKPLGLAPIVLAGTAAIEPVAWELPDVTAPLLEIQDSNTKASARWTHSSDEAVNVVSFTSKREFLASIDEAERKDTLSRLRIRDQIDTDGNVSSIAKLGLKEVRYEPTTIRSISRSSTGDVTSGERSSSLGARLLQNRLLQVKDRFVRGGQRITCECRRGTSTVDTAKVGSWALVTLSWLPEYGTGTRSTNRLMQVVKVREVDAAWRGFELSDAGPSAQPTGLPTINALSQSEGMVTIPVASIPTAGSFARVDIAVSAAEPASDSGLWSFAGRRNTTGDVVIGPFPSGVTVWARVRGEEAHRRRSGWSASRSIVLTSTPRILSVDIRFLPSGEPIVYWQANGATAGVRIHYAFHTRQTDDYTAALVLTADHAASAGADGVAIGGLIIPTFGQDVTVTVTPYSGFGAGAVSGTAGFVSPRVTARNFGDVQIPITVTPITSETETVGTLTLTIDDPQLRVTKVEFRTWDPALAVWSAWAIDSVIPYAASVTLVAGDPVKIGYRVTGYDLAGEIDVLAADEVPFVLGTEPGGDAVVEASFTAFGDLRVVVYGDSDTSTIKIEATTGSPPTDAAIRATAGVVGPTAVKIFPGPFAPGTLLYIGAFAYGPGGTPESDRIDSSVVRESSEFFTVQEQPSETDTTATLTLVITDPLSRITQVAFRYQIGDSSAWTAYVADATIPYSASANLTEKQITRIQYKITGKDDVGIVRVLREDVVAFKAGSKPMIPLIDADFNATGQINLLITGDSDTAKIRYAYGTSIPADPVAETPQNGRVFRATIATAYEMGQDVYIKAIAESVNGTQSDVGLLKITRGGLADVVVQEVTAETSTTGTLTLTIVDPGGRVLAVEFRTWDPVTRAWAAWVADASIPYSASVTLVEKHLAKIAYRLTGKGSLGGSAYIIREDVIGFASGSIPFLPSIDVSFTATGGVNIEIRGDSDTNGIRYATSLTDYPSGGTVAGQALQVGRTFRITTTDTIQIGDPIYVTAIAYNAAGEASATAVIKANREGIVEPTIQEVPSSTATVGTLTLVIVDPTSRVLTVEFRTWNNATRTWSAYTLDAAAPYAASTTLVEKQAGQIGYRVIGKGPQGGTNYIIRENVVPFNSATTPGGGVIDISFNADGTANITITGDVDTEYISYAYSTAAMPTDATVRLQPSNSGRSLSHLTGNIGGPGVRLYVKAFLYAVGGIESFPFTAIQNREGSGVPGPPRAFIALNGTQTKSTANVIYRGALGQDGTGALEYRRRIDTESGEGAWSAWAALGAGVTEAITRSAYYTKRVEAQVRDVALIESPVAGFDIISRLDAIDSGTGKVDDGVTMKGGFNPFKKGGDTAADVVETSGRNFTDSSMLDGSRRIVNVFRSGVTKATTVLFEKAVDTAGDVVESYGRNFVLADMIDASRRIVSVYRNSVTESAANLFKKGSDSLDDVVESATRSAVNPSALTGSRDVGYVNWSGALNDVFNLFKKGTSVSGDVVEQSTRVFVHDDQTDGSRRINTVYRSGANTAVENLVAEGSGLVYRTQLFEDGGAMYYNDSGAAKVVWAASAPSGAPATGAGTIHIQY